MVKSIDDETQLVKMLKLDEENPIIPESKFRVTVKNVNRLEESDLNQEFFDKIFGTLAEKSTFSPFLAVWFPNIVFGVLAIYLLRNAKR